MAVHAMWHAYSKNKFGFIAYTNGRYCTVTYLKDSVGVGLGRVRFSHLLDKLGCPRGPGRSVDLHILVVILIDLAEVTGHQKLLKPSN